LLIIGITFHIIFYFWTISPAAGCFGAARHGTWVRISQMRTTENMRSYSSTTQQRQE